jgi:hypothetical protein
MESPCISEYPYKAGLAKRGRGQVEIQNKGVAVVESGLVGRLQQLYHKHRRGSHLNLAYLSKQRPKYLAKRVWLTDYTKKAKCLQPSPIYLYVCMGEQDLYNPLAIKWSSRGC